MNSYVEVTKGIEIKVTPKLSQENTTPGEQYVYIYDVEIKNQSVKTVQLLRRHWIITDGTGRREEVKGDGVIGEQPTLSPGQSHSYSSFCPLPTPTGNMRGSYEFVDEQGELLQVKIPLFFFRDESVLN